MNEISKPLSCSASRSSSAKRGDSIIETFASAHRSGAANVPRWRSSMPSQALWRRTTELTQVWRRRGDAMILDHPVIPLFGRLMMTYICATSGIGKIFGWSGNVAYMNTRHLPLIPVLLAVAMVIEVAGSACFVTGYQARFAAFVMFWYTTAVTVLFPNYLGSSEMMAAIEEKHFSQKPALLGWFVMSAWYSPAARRRRWMTAG